MNKENFVELVNQSKKFKKLANDVSGAIPICLRDIQQEKEMIEQDFVGYSHLCEKLQEAIQEITASKNILLRVEEAAGKMNDHVIQLAETQKRQSLNLYMKVYKTAVDELLHFWAMARKIEELGEEAHSMCVNNAELNKVKTVIANRTSIFHECAKDLSVHLSSILNHLELLSKELSAT